MPTIWIKDRTGKVFHFTTEIASWEGGYNTPETAIPASAVINQNRCINTITIKVGTDTLTMSLAQHGREGACVQCGQCCSHLRELCLDPKGKCGYLHRGKHHVCEHLIEYPREGGIGAPGGTACNIHDRLLVEGLKGCIVWPEGPGDIAGIPACGMRFK